VRSSLRVFSSLLIVAGVLLVADAIATVTWQEPVSWLYSRMQQDQLGSQLADLEGAEPTPVERRALSSMPDDGRRLAFAARALDRRVEPGRPLGRLELPTIGVEEVFVAGTNGADLRKGPGHYPATPLPGARGTVAIAGHRTTYGAPFRRIDRLRSGDRLRVVMPYGTFTYRVERKRIVEPTATWVTRRVRFDRLVLTACHPLYSAAQRIVVFARLERSAPRGSLARVPGPVAVDAAAVG
jgi:sortase A